MQPTTLRLPEELADELAAEAGDLGYSSRSEYIRHLLRSRTDGEPNTSATPDRHRTEYADDLRDRVDDLEQRLSALEAAETSRDTDATPREGASGAADAPGGGEVPQDVERGSNSRGEAPDDVRERLREELPGSGERLTARVDAILAMGDQLKRLGEAEKSDLLEVVDVEPTGYDDIASFWSNAVKGRDTLRGLEGVEAPDSGLSTWRYVG